MSRAPSGGEDEAPHSGGRGNIAAIIAIVVIAALGYWAFNSIDHQRKMQNCLEFGATRLRALGALGSLTPAIDLLASARHKPGLAAARERRVHFFGSPLG